MTVGTGFTVIENVSDVPTQPFKTGVIVIFDDCGELTFAAIKFKSPVPEAAKPMAVFVLTQLTLAPLGVVVNGTSIKAPAQTETFSGNFTEGVGGIVIEKVWATPEQPFKIGVTVIFAVIGEPVLLTAAVKLRLPEPLPANPISLLSFVQSKVVPTRFATKLILTFCPLQANWLPGLSSTGRGLTCTVTFVAALEQPLAVAVTVRLDVIVAVVVFDKAVKFNGLDVPEAGIPVFKLSFTQLNVGVVPVVKFVTKLTIALSFTQKAKLVVVITGVGLTVIKNVSLPPAQPFTEGVTMIVATRFAPVVFAAVMKLILPEPDAASPTAVLSFVQVNGVPAIFDVKLTAAV